MFRQVVDVGTNYSQMAILGPLRFGFGFGGRKIFFFFFWGGGAENLKISEWYQIEITRNIEIY